MTKLFSLNKFLGYIDIGYDKVSDGYDLYDKQGVYELTYYNEEMDEETSIYPDIPSVVDRVSGIWYDWIDEDLRDEFGCNEDFHGDFYEMLNWIEKHRDTIYAEDYAVYTKVLKCILDPGLLVA